MTDIDSMQGKKCGQRKSEERAQDERQGRFTTACNRARMPFCNAWLRKRIIVAEQQPSPEPLCTIKKSPIKDKSWIEEFRLTKKTI